MGVPWHNLPGRYPGIYAHVCDARQRLTLKLRYNKSFENKVSPTTAIEMH
jgi:hypothetical protein